MELRINTGNTPPFVAYSKRDWLVDFRDISGLRFAYFGVLSCGMPKICAAFGCDSRSDREKKPCLVPSYDILNFPMIPLCK